MQSLNALLRRWLLPPLDAPAPHPPVWAALLWGAGLGLLWGVAARGWMRLITTRPEFSIEGTTAILLIATVFGVWVGLAFVARRRGWAGWRHYLPRSLVVIFFLPFGMAGGFPLMLTVLVATLAMTQPIFGLWLLVALILLMSVGTDIGVPLMAAGGVLAGAVILTTGQWLARNRWPRVSLWLERLARIMLLLLAAFGFWTVAQDIATTQPSGLAVVAIGLYLLLLYPLFLALRVGLTPRRKALAAPEND